MEKYFIEKGFPKMKQEKNGLYSQCKTCVRKCREEQYNENRNRLKYHWEKYNEGKLGQR